MPGDEAARGIGLHARRITPDMVHADRHEYSAEHEPVPEPGARLQSCDILCDQNRERVDRGDAVPDRVADADDRQARERIVAEGERERDENGDERQVLLRHADRAGPRHEEQHPTDQQPQRAVAESAERSAEHGIDRSGLAQDRERAADDEDEEYDLRRRNQAARYGGEDGDRRKRRMVRYRREAAGHHLHAAVLVLHSLVLSGRQHPGEQKREHDHAEEQHERVWNAGPAWL